MKALDTVGLGDRADHKPNQLSGGQQQRVAIARALANQPSLLLADEPTGNLDSRTSVDIMGVFQKLNDQGMTIVMVTHELDIAQYTKRMVVMRDGKVVGDSPVAGRLNAANELRRLQAEQKAVQLDGLDSMRYFVILKVAFRALRRNKLRTALTMLGIIIGVGAVIAMVGFGNGAKAQVQATIAALGQNVIMVFSGSINRNGVYTGSGGAGTLTVDDALAIEKEVPGVVAVSPEVRSGAQIMAGNNNWSTMVWGEGVGYLTIRQWDIADGTMFTEAHVRSAAKVCVLGKTTADKFFPDEDPVGKTIRIRNVPMKVLGVLRAKGASMFGSDQDDTILVPYTTGMKRFAGVGTLRSINVQAATSEQILEVQTAIGDLLRERHRIPPGHDDDFILRNQQEIAETMNAITNVLTALLASIASVSLLVGGIGIMNIMLVSVTERTREIGIRMAVGARGRDILLQFLIEAVALSSTGGVVGILCGFGGAKLITSIYEWPTLVSAHSIVEQIIEVQTAIGELLRQRHRIQPGHDDDFTVRNQQEIAETITPPQKC